MIKNEKCLEPSNEITWNFVILEAVVLIILFFEQLFNVEFKAWPLSLNPIYLFIFNLFIVDKFISVTTRIAFRKQQGLSQTPGAVNKITECWYRWYKIFETKSPFAVLIKVNPKQTKNKKKHPMQPTDNWHYIIMNW